MSVQRNYSLFVLTYNESPTFAYGVYRSRQEAESVSMRLLGRLNDYETLIGEVESDAAISRVVENIINNTALMIDEVKPAETYDFRASYKYWNGAALYDLIVTLQKGETAEWADDYDEYFPDRNEE